jgi:hypothetical protein
MLLSICICECTYRHQVPVDPPQEPLVSRSINLDDLSLRLLERLHSLVGIVGMLEDFLVYAAISDCVCQRVRDALVDIRVERVLFWIHIGCGDGGIA